MARKPKLIREFMAVGVFNEYEFYLSGQPLSVPHIDYYPPGNYRAGEYAHWAVSMGGVDLGTSWLDRGGKRFSITHSQADRFARVGTTAECKKIALAEAIEWATKRFNVKDWAEDPFGAYGPANFVPRRVEELRTAAKAKREEGET